VISSRQNCHFYEQQPAPYHKGTWSHMMQKLALWQSCCVDHTRSVKSVTAFSPSVRHAVAEQRTITWHSHSLPACMPPETWRRLDVASVCLYAGCITSHQPRPSNPLTSWYDKVDRFPLLRAAVCRYLSYLCPQSEHLLSCFSALTNKRVWWLKILNAWHHRTNVS